MNGKKLIRCAGTVLLSLLILAAGYLGYVLRGSHRISDNAALIVSTDTLLSESGALQPMRQDAVPCGEMLRAASANIGFGAYSADYSFFMDGGRESRARSPQAVRENVLGCVGAIAPYAPDFLLAQEVDTDGTRSHHVDERAYIARVFSGQTVEDTFAQNYNSPYLLYPLRSPHGANQSGIMTFSTFPIRSALRRSLPVEKGLRRLVDLDRCYSVNRIAAENGKELVLYNLHLSAYTSDGSIATEQLRMLCEDMQSEYDAGNYCVAGGDFNKDLLGDSGSIFGVAKQESDVWAQPIPDGLIPEGLTLVVPFDASEPVATCRTASEPYDPETTFRVTVDGFLVSGNVSVLGAQVIDTGYAFSDHNPVCLDFMLK